jgi:hypothetical protein
MKRTGGVRIFDSLIKARNKNILNENATYVVIEYEAVNKWGDYTLKQNIFLKALQNDNEDLVRRVLIIFIQVRFEAIKIELCRLTKQTEQQDTRILAASALTDFNDKSTVPYMILVLKEVYIKYKDPIGIKVLATIFTFGISSILDSISADMSRNDFNSRVAEIGKGLSRITRTDYGGSYGHWLEWAILNGYSVDGVNK